MKVHNIEIRFSNPYSPASNGMIERFNGTIKRMLYKYFIAHNTHKWSDIMQSFVNTYNSSKHRIINMAPNDAIKKNSKALNNIISEYPDQKDDKKDAFKIGDLVRVQMVNKKSYQPYFSTEVFKIIDIQSHHLLQVTYTYTVESDKLKISNLSYHQLIHSNTDTKKTQDISKKKRLEKELKQLV